MIVKTLITLAVLLGVGANYLYVLLPYGKFISSPSILMLLPFWVTCILLFVFFVWVLRILEFGFAAAIFGGILASLFFYQKEFFPMMYGEVDELLITNIDILVYVIQTVIGPASFLAILTYPFEQEEVKAPKKA